jgi:acyl carrier protein
MSKATLSEVTEGLNDILSEFLGNFDNNTKLYDSGLDSLDLITIIMKCEIKWNIKIPEDDTVHWEDETVGQIAQRLTDVINDSN